MSGQVRVIIITGTMGAGKTAILSEASDILKSAGLIHAAIDLDTPGIAYIPSPVASTKISAIGLSCHLRIHAAPTS